MKKMSGKNYHNIMDREPNEGKIDCGVFKGTNCIKKKLDNVSEFKEEL